MASHLVREGDSAEGARIHERLVSLRGAAAGRNFFHEIFFQNFFYTIHERLVSLRGAAAGRNTRKSVYTALIIVKRYHTDFSEFV